MRLLFFGDMASTGFGSVTTDLGRALLDKGVDVRFVSQNDFTTLPEPFASRTLDLTTYDIVQPEDDPDHHGGIIPKPSLIKDVLGDGAAGHSLADGNSWGDWRPDAVFLLGDYYGVRLMMAPHMTEFAKVPTYHYVPIEGHDLPPLWKGMWQVAKPLAMSKFGQAEIEKVVGYTPPLLYHGVDTTIFRPVSTTEPIRLVIPTKEDQPHRDVILSSKERCKAFFGINPRARMLLRTDRNMPRKAYPALLRSLEPVMAERPDVVLALKCSDWDQGGYLADSISKMPQHIGERVVLMEASLPRYALVALYNAADIYVSNSAEGFGLTIAEALACGVPAVGLDYSSVPEVIGPAGQTVPVGMTWDNGYGHFWALPDEREFGKAVAYYLDHPARAREAGARGPEHVARTFSWAKAADIFMEYAGVAQREMVAA